MKLIVAVDENWGIGCNGNLLFKIKKDQEFFKKTTLKKIVVMGNTTLKSLPKGMPLKERTNIVLTRNKDLSSENIIYCVSLDELFRTLNNFNSDDVYIIGGESIYFALLKYSNEALVTKIYDKNFADKFFPNLDNLSDWNISSRSGILEENGLKFEFFKYVNVMPEKYKLLYSNQ